MKYKVGDRVRLIPIPEEGFPEEFGEVVGSSTYPSGTTYVIQLDDKYCPEPDDDGLREVTEDQLEKTA